MDSIKDVLQNLALAEIEKLLNNSGSSLQIIPNMPLPDHDFIQENCNMLIHDELQYDRQILEEEHDVLYSSLTLEQRNGFDTIMESAAQDIGGLYFLYGYGGTGKTFVWKTLAAAIRSKGEIVINVASSGIVALLLSGGRTAHSRFSIPINISEDSYCSISPDSDLAELINKAKLIIWDEAPMMHRYCFEALDRTMRDIIRSPNKGKPFGGKVVVLGGDFRQILPVVPKGSRADIVHASLNYSHLWRHCKVIKLTKNMRLLAGCVDSESQQIKEFAEWLLKIGEGKLGKQNDGEADIVFPEELLVQSNGDHVEAIVASIYPKLSENMNNPQYFQDKAILAPTNEEVDHVNEHVLSIIDSDEHIYYSSDSLCPDEDNDIFAQQLYSPEILNGLKVPGIPNHKLVLKPGVPIMLLRNINQSKGLCNGTRLLIQRLGNNTIEATIISGTFIGEVTHIPRMVISPTDKKIPVKFQRRQFPISVCYAMTINKSQGQSLSRVGLFLRKPVFTHGQLYVAVSRVTSKQGLKILICDENENLTNTTKNVVYKEVLQRI